MEKSDPGRRECLTEGRGCNSSGGVHRAITAQGDGSLHVYLVDAWEARALLGGRRRLQVSPWMSIREVKKLIEKLLKIPTPNQHLFWRSAELENHRTLEESGVHRSGATLLFDARPEAGGARAASLEPVSCATLHGGRLPPVLGKALLRARRGLAVGNKAPELAMDGTGGTYFLAGLDGGWQGCFKPADEETFMPNNPRCFAGHGAEERRGVRPGEAHAREAAAYLLDARSGGLAGVPETTLAASAHPRYAYADRRVVEKPGSFQVYVPHEGVAEDFAPERFEARRLQAIAALDLRCLNADRNAANLLVPRRRRRRDEPIRLVPIDHGFCLPERLAIEWFDWCWIDWPALREPVCAPVAAAVAALDADADAAFLRDALGLRPAALRLLRAATRLLQMGVGAGLTLRDVAELVIRPDDSERPTRDVARAGRLAVAVARATELADLALAEGRALGARGLGLPSAPFPASRPIRVPEPFEEEGLSIDLESSASSQDLPPSPARSRGSPRWADGLPARVPQLPRGVPASPMDRRREARDFDSPGADRASPVSDSSGEFLPAPPRKRDGRASPPPLPVVTPDDGGSPASGGRPRADSRLGEMPSGFARRVEGKPLVRLHSCPSFAAALREGPAARVGDDLRRTASRLDGRPLARMRSVDELEHEAHFRRYLDDLLADLVAWKKRRLDFPPIAA